VPSVRAESRLINIMIGALREAFLPLSAVTAVNAPGALSVLAIVPFGDDGENSRPTADVHALWLNGLRRPGVRRVPWSDAAQKHCDRRRLNPERSLIPD